MNSSSSPLLIDNVAVLRRHVADARRAGKVVGVVPTMGALHAGHASLVEACSRECDLTIVTIFVNPTQFGPGEDFGRYPRTLEADLQLMASHGAQIVFAPSTDSMYAPGHCSYVEVGGPAERWEGAFRPGHFRGVATIVLKLLNVVQVDRAYFGRKDYQQSLVVRRMVADLNLDVHIEVCPTVREPDGLAMSSRNIYLSADERKRALSISQSLRLAGQLVEQGTRDVATIVTRMQELLERAKLQIDYIALADPDTLEPVAMVDRPTVALIAARVGSTRLIDNAPIG